MEIHQFHPSFVSGDAIGNEMIELQKVLTALGYKSNIYSQYRDSKTPPSKNYKEYIKNSSSDNILIIHYSIAYDNEILSFIRSLPDKKMLIYHNITPSQYFTRINSQYEFYAKLGRKQLESFSEIVEYAVGDSEYNRQELIELGFKKTDVLPILIDFAKYKNTHNSNFKKNEGLTNLLFVGRISPNKKQDDIIKTFYFYKKCINPKSRLYLIGSYKGMEKYYNQLTELIKYLKLDDVYFTGKIDFEELIAYYKLADIFLCMSEHEGFCVPLIESMYFDIPIIAFNSSAIPYTLGNSSILINKKKYVEIAELINLIVKNEKLREKIIKKQQQRLKYFSRDGIERIFRMQLDCLINNCVDSKKSIQIEGTFEDNYSLSIVNRNLALALNKFPMCNLSLHATTGDGDYIPNLKFADADIVALYNKKIDKPDFVIRNIYPPRIHDMNGNYNIIYFYWEESQIPPQWVDEFDKLDAILVPTFFVRQVLINSGVKTQISVVPNGVNHRLLKTKQEKILEVNTEKKYRFLNISSGFPRKGVDILLAAFNEEFTKNDDICLIIKTFPNIHNKISEFINNLKKTNRNCPEIIHIDRDLDESNIAWLYNNSDCLVYPTRGEGFGLPIAEAMLFKIPVITTSYSGHLDFCNNDNCFLINYKLEPSQSHLKKEWNIKHSYWAEPDKHHLKRLMRLVYETKNIEVIKKKTENAYERVVKLTWNKMAIDTFKILETLDRNNKVKVGIISTWNTKCGIAEYTKYLVKNVENAINIEILANYENSENINKTGTMVIRCWEKYNDDLIKLYQQIKCDNLEIVHFQFNFGFFELKTLMHLIKQLKHDNVKTIITFHSVEDTNILGINARLSDFKEDLKIIDRIWVHTINDCRFLSKFGIKDNVVLIPQGINKFPINDKNTIKHDMFSNKTIISSFGFLLPHKGILEIIESLPNLLKKYSDILFLSITAIYPDDISMIYFEKCNKRIKELGLSKNVIFITEYLQDEEIIELLRLSDLLVMPYKNTKESSSAAIRFALSSHKPLIVTKIPIFDEFEDEVYKIKKCTSQHITNGIINVLENNLLQENIVNHATKTVEKYCWENIAKQYEKIIWELI